MSPFSDADINNLGLIAPAAARVNPEPPALVTEKAKSGDRYRQHVEMGIKWTPSAPGSVGSERSITHAHLRGQK